MESFYCTWVILQASNFINKLCFDRKTRKNELIDGVYQKIIKNKLVVLVD